MAPILEVYTLDELEQIQVGVPRAMLLLMISYFAVFLMALGVYLGIAWYERKRQKGADELDLEDARESIIMPFHKPLILLVMGVSLSMGITVGLAPVPTSLTEGELLYAMRNFSVNVVVWTMQYPAVSRSTTLKAIAWATLFSLVPIPIIYAVEQHRPLGDVYLTLLFVRAATAGHYVYNLLWPPTSRGAASSIRWYSGLGLLYTLLVMAYHMAFKYHYFAIGYNCVYAASSFLVFSPLFLYNIFREDTKFWRGAHAVFPPSREFRQIVARFKNLTADEVDAYDEAVRRMIVDAATVILNFASLEFKVPHSVEGVGRTATVASGLLHGYENMEPQRVAIKTFNPELFLADEVAKVALETSIATLPTMRNKYIVHGFGLAVHPPALCLVSDLCEMSLASHLRAKGLGLSLRVRLTYMLHCAKGVGWTHANMVLHRDVRPANFFVQTLFETQDLQKIIKLSDFGDAIFEVTE
ncbi:hypothetical protein SPRG_07727 [Saprolegnia parasitica CBS 223.65]|uniref:Protein kinase domain-containing protein n=1 Tax=Saprolegnia parasitica (strain CBS 223.65) TaxID=695850 RepID=A0A067CCV3_SAPPC|nr:hypothetical protein SPRG_07727 [Saprolegnia parasitica CBS 223.65]KDO27015.1 hypothetical protein SPRG_07727 [Saprolegnia parasitica CBS 223.65]|eukprot:XP_012202392.1 hypothetical protein SPRG_07727 [Saprolegnia parasitica CBS 223.65]